MVGLSSLSRPCRTYLCLVVFSLAGSLFSRVTRLDPGPIAPVASALTLLTGFFAICEPVWRQNPKLNSGWMAGALLSACAVELCGIFTGFPFGDYAYTDAWKPAVELQGKWFPLMVPVAWLLVVGASYLLFEGKRLQILCGALLATGVDFVMEPVMAGPLGYWHWAVKGPLPGGASLLNPVGWFAGSCVVGYLISQTHLENRRIAAIVLGGHLALTIGIGLVLAIPR